MGPAQFLNTLWGDAPPGFVLVWTMPDRRSYWYSSFEAVDADVGRHEHRDVYTGTGLAPRTGVRLTPRTRIKEHEVAGIPGLWADIDLRHPVHKKSAALPPTADQALGRLGHDPIPANDHRG